MLLRVGSAAAETIDATVTVAASGQLPLLAVASAAVPQENRNAVAGGAGDLDGDGHLDVLIWHRLPEEPPLLLLGDGAGGFREAGTARLPLLAEGQTGTAALVDLDGDGDLDAYLGRSPADAVWINEGALFRDDTRRWLPADWGGTTAVVAGDLTGDARPEVVILQGGRLRVLDNVSGAGLRETTASWLLDPAQGLAGVLLLDADGDGDLDIAAAAEDGVTLWRHDGARLRPEPKTAYPVNGPILGVRSADVTQDGAEDVIVTRHGGPVVLERPGTPQASARLDAVPGEGIVNDAVVADLDRDGFQELLLAVTGPDAVCADATGQGAWRADARWLPADNEATRLLLLGDFNEDGLSDVYAASDGQDRLLLQQRQTLR
jgi:hypothetical protein